VSVRLFYFIDNVSSIGIDGGLYCDLARAISSHGTFSSHIINDGTPDPYFNVEGFMSYPLTVFSIVTFFISGNVSYETAKLTVFFAGILVVFLIYKLSNELFGKEIALIAGLLSAFLPILSFYSSILNGPEILSALFSLASIYFFVLGVRGSNGKLHYMSLSGLFATMTYGAWGIQAFVLLIVSLMVIFAVFKLKQVKLVIFTLAITSILIFLTRFGSIPLAQLPLAAITIVCLLIFARKNKNPEYSKAISFIIISILSLQLLFLKNYLVSDINVFISTNTFITDPGTVINPLTFTLRTSGSFGYIFSSFSRLWESVISILTPLLFGVALPPFLVLNG
jgi:4-amino-4-deoxy-L-arabinose transferase-like glycosyltransferase